MFKANQKRARFLSLPACLALFTVFLSFSSHASDEQWYQVELIVFEHLDKKGLQETWPLDPGRPNVSDARSLISEQQASSDDASVQSEQARLNYLAVKDSQLQLTDARERVANQGSYRIIFHKGWKQKIADKKLAEPLRLIGGKQYESATNSYDNQFGDELAMAYDNDMGSHLDMQNSYEVDGTLRISKGRYLHIDTDLVFTRPMRVLTPATGLQGSLTTGSPKVSLANVSNRSRWQHETNARLQPFRLSQSVRMRSNEVQYIDHPLYGILVAIMPEESS